MNILAIVFKVVCFIVYPLVDVNAIVVSNNDDDLLWDLVLTANEGEDSKSADVAGNISSVAAISVLAAYEFSSGNTLKFEIIP